MFVRGLEARPRGRALPLTLTLADDRTTGPVPADL
jgi:hypothetical protein